ncbi:acyltransferase family protein [Alloacidobacterium sp.]|uniref:acyltransferase family protein n=1 Tax=Alloacidobacterium sp. TaxID=2951999 RepID=UPI002D2A592A|nr:heparan-alpha-glucosaminide N-acetyltransferase domain-containing protein [Alloacidobacterium sp.]HYK37094.1 heparan-alpha-glucosaminide N-acetyltransferase domain-containing protein [Alloacidobacterium sp.]
MTATTITNPATAGVQTRLISLDVLRGITIAFMILVNNNGDERYAYWPLKHSLWNGWTPTDLVFPTFLFVAGVSLVFSFQSRLAKGASKKSLLAHAVKRSIILFALGLVVNGFPFFHWPTLRIYGVLQRFAICLLIASVLHLWKSDVKSKVVVILAALFGYWIIMRWIPVPGYGLPTRDIPLLDKDANWVAYIDRHIFPGRLYEGTRDPEGLLSNLPALGTALLGMLTAIWLRTKKSAQNKFVGLLVAAIAGLILGKIWGHWFPINKKLWTSSYVLFAAGWSLLGLAVFYWMIEIKQWRRGWTFPWVVFGSNSIAVYVFSELLAAALGAFRIGADHQAIGHIIYSHSFAHVPDPAFGSLLYSLTFVTVCFIPVLVLYKKKVFIKI